jgi:hypothetical protein
MDRALRALLTLTLIACGGSVRARTPVIVELYTAQGCASCAEANALAADLAKRPGVVTLSFNVDYWDYLGWKDTFAQPEFVARQRAYDRRFGRRDVYTPQIVVGGAAQASGDKGDAVEALIRDEKRSKPPAGAPSLWVTRDGRAVAGGGLAPPGGAEVWLVRYDPAERSVLVRDGENRGKTVSLRGVVVQLVRLGRWAGAQQSYRAIAAPEQGLSTLALVQGAHGGRILASALAPAKSSRPPHSGAR